MLDVLDGHIHLSQQMATRGIYPAINPLKSVSRLMPNITSDDHRKLSKKLNDVYATYKEAEDLINIGAYSQGSNPKIDQAIQKYELMIPYLKQGIVESVDWRTSINELKKILEDES